MADTMLELVVHDSGVALKFKIVRAVGGGFIFAEQHYEDIGSLLAATMYQGLKTRSGVVYLSNSVGDQLRRRCGAALPHNARCHLCFSLSRGA